MILNKLQKHVLLQWTSFLPLEYFHTKLQKLVRVSLALGKDEGNSCCYTFHSNSRYLGENIEKANKK